MPAMSSMSACSTSSTTKAPSTWTSAPTRGERQDGPACRPGMSSPDRPPTCPPATVQLLARRRQPEIWSHPIQADGISATDEPGSAPIWWKAHPRDGDAAPAASLQEPALKGALADLVSGEAGQKGNSLDQRRLLA